MTIHPADLEAVRKERRPHWAGFAEVGRIVKDANDQAAIAKEAGK